MPTSAIYLYSCFFSIALFQLSNLYYYVSPRSGNAIATAQFLHPPFMPGDLSLPFHAIILLLRYISSQLGASILYENGLELGVYSSYETPEPITAPLVSSLELTLFLFYPPPIPEYS